MVAQTEQARFTGEYLVLILLSLLLLILGVGAFFFWLATRHGRQRQALAEAALRHPPSRRWPDEESFRPEIFDSPCRWIAVRTTEPRAVQKALKLANPTLCTWAEGLAEARDRRLFITPPIGEWVLVVGSSLPDPGDDVDECFHLLTDLSRKLGLVQFFSLNRALGHHAWARLDAGEVLRAYAWAGHVMWNQGPPSPAELGLDLRCYEYLEEVEKTGAKRTTQSCRTSIASRCWLHAGAWTRPRLMSGTLRLGAGLSVKLPELPDLGGQRKALMSLESALDEYPKS